MQTQINPHIPPRKKGAKRKRKWPFVISAFLLLLALAGGLVWWEFNEFLNKISPDQEDGLTKEEPAVSKTYKREPMSMVIVGVDSREGLGLMNTDVLIVATVNPKTKHVTMLSVPRDTGVKIPGYRGFHKINSVYAKGEAERRKAERNGETITVTGTNLLKKTLENAFGIPIQHYVMIDFEGFERVIDRLGGVQIDVEKSMKYNDPTDGTHIDLEPGLQVLSGKQALDYVRHRKDDRGSKYYSSDFERGERQQKVIKAMADKMKSFSGVTSFFSVLDVAGDHVRTDLSKDKITGLIMDFKSIGSENITSLEITGSWDGVHVIIPPDNLKQIQLAFQHELGTEGMTQMASGTVKSDPQQSSTPSKTKQPVAPAPAPKSNKEPEQKADPEQEKEVEPIQPTVPERQGENAKDPNKSASPHQESPAVPNEPDPADSPVQPSPSPSGEQPSSAPEPAPPQQQRPAGTGVQPNTTEQSGLLQPPAIPLEPKSN